jgi:hypothetical protein
MTYVWELDVDVFNLPPSGHGPLHSAWHLKKVWDKDPLEGQFAIPRRGQWKVSVAWVNKVSDRKYNLRFAKGDCDDKTFRSLKAAKAYAVAIITLEQ